MFKVATFLARMIPKSGDRFSEKIMRKEKCNSLWLVTKST
jgi:hypothetical protein